MTSVYKKTLTTDSVINRLYRTAVLSPNQRVRRKLPGGATAYLRYIPAGNKIDIALALPGRWPEINAWNDVLNALPVNSTAVDMQKQLHRSGLHILYAKDVEVTTR